MHFLEPQFQNFLREAPGAPIKGGPPPHGLIKPLHIFLLSLSAAYSELLSLYFQFLGEPCTCIQLSISWSNAWLLSYKWTNKSVLVLGCKILMRFFPKTFFPAFELPTQCVTYLQMWLIYLLLFSVCCIIKIIKL